MFTTTYLSLVTAPRDRLHRFAWSAALLGASAVCVTARSWAALTAVPGPHLAYTYIFQGPSPTVGAYQSSYIQYVKCVPSWGGSHPWSKTTISTSN